MAFVTGYLVQRFLKHNTVGVCDVQLNGLCHDFQICSQAVFSAGAKLTVRALRTSNPSLVIVFWMSGLSSILAGLACVVLPNHFVLPRDKTDWLLLLATGVSGLLHQVSSALYIHLWIY